ncbi:MAG: glycoside hydrolase N-terminal domain-containing protein, partial [Armatimonadetes bacterium]|nr:glycoside hydrolase N-terminal domain-containing protein [Armatimonadota bacterium]
MSDRAYRMTLRQPATRWEDALPSGNGSLGALVYGNIRREVVLLNHEELWLRTPRPELPGVSHHLPELRALLASGRYREAVRFLDSKLREHRYAARPDPYHPA